MTLSSDTHLFKDKDESFFLAFSERLKFLLAFEELSIMEKLTTPESIIDFLNILEVYDVDFLADIQEVIADGANPIVFQAFIHKHKVKWGVKTPHLNKFLKKLGGQKRFDKTEVCNEILERAYAKHIKLRNKTAKRQQGLHDTN